MHSHFQNSPEMFNQVQASLPAASLKDVQRVNVNVAIGFLAFSLTKAALPRLLRLARWPAVGGVLMVRNVFHLLMMEANVLPFFFLRSIP